MGCGVWVVGIGEYSWFGYLDGEILGSETRRVCFEARRRHRGVNCSAVVITQWFRHAEICWVAVEHVHIMQ
jgi:hypothetical protein